MSEERKKCAGLWAIVIAAGLILYPLSWGPASWLIGSSRIPVWADHAYDPLRWVLDISPDCVRDSWSHYLGWWLSHVDLPYYNPATGNWE